MMVQIKFTYTHLGRSGGLVVSMLVHKSDDPSSNSAEVFSFSDQRYKNTYINEKEVEVCIIFSYAVLIY